MPPQRERSQTVPPPSSEKERPAAVRPQSRRTADSDHPQHLPGLGHFRASFRTFFMNASRLLPLDSPAPTSSGLPCDLTPPLSSTSNIPCGPPDKKNTEGTAGSSIRKSAYAPPIWGCSNLGVSCSALVPSSKKKRPPGMVTTIVLACLRSPLTSSSTATS